MKRKIIVKFFKDDEGISTEINGACTIEVLMGMAQLIQTIEEKTKKNKKGIVNDLNKILEVLDKEEEEK